MFAPQGPFQKEWQQKFYHNALRVVHAQGPSYIAALEAAADRIYKSEAEFLDSMHLPIAFTAPPRNKTLVDPAWNVTSDLLSDFPLIGPLSNGLVGIPRNELEWKDYHAPNGLVSSHVPTPPQFMPISSDWTIGMPGLPDAGSIAAIHEQFMADAPNPQKAEIFSTLNARVSHMSFLEVQQLVAPPEWQTVLAALQKNRAALDAVFLQELVSRMVSASADAMQRERGGELASSSTFQSRAAAAFRVPFPAGPGTFRAAVPYVAGDPRMNQVNPTIYSTTAFQSSVDVSGKTVSNWGVLPFRTTAVAL